jgi:hypothetical protein
VGDQNVTSVRLRYALVLGALSASLLYGTSVVPYWFPPQEFVVGVSYEVGFNNAVSYVVYLALVPLLALVAARSMTVDDSERDITVARQSSDWGGAVLVTVILAHVALFASVYAYKGRFVFGESLYFQSLLHRMMQGDVPYIDFSFYYGPTLLYPSFWLAERFGLDAGYGICFVSTYVIGLLFLYRILGFCVTTPRDRAVWFTFLAAGFFNPLTGLNVTLTRYLLPSVVFLAAASFVRRGGFGRGVVAVALLACALTYSFEAAALSLSAVVFVWLAQLLSPKASAELRRFFRGVVFGRSIEAEAVAFSTEGATWHLSTLRSAGLTGAAMAFCVACFLLIDPSGRALADYSAVARSYAAGAHGLPIYPHLPFIVLTLLTVAGLAGLLRVVTRMKRREELPLAIGYGLVALLAQRAAFGAAEPSHFAYFGLPAFLIALFVTNHFRQRYFMRTCLSIALIVGVILPMQYYHFTEFAPFLVQRLAGSADIEDAAAETVSRPAMTTEEDLRDIVRALGSGYPYLMYDLEYYSLPVYREFGLRYPTYFTMLMNARDEQGVRRFIDEVRDQEAFVIIARSTLGTAKPLVTSSGLRRVIDTLSGAHTRGSELAVSGFMSKQRLVVPFLAFLKSEYVPIYERGGLVAFGPR